MLLKKAVSTENSILFTLGMSGKRLLWRGKTFLNSVFFYNCRACVLRNSLSWCIFQCCAFRKRINNMKLWKSEGNEYLQQQKRQKSNKLFVIFVFPFCLSSPYFFLSLLFSSTFPFSYFPFSTFPLPTFHLPTFPFLTFPLPTFPLLYFSSPAPFFSSPYFSPSYFSSSYFSSSNFSSSYFSSSYFSTSIIFLSGSLHFLSLLFLFLLFLFLIFLFLLFPFLLFLFLLFWLLLSRVFYSWVFSLVYSFHSLPLFPLFLKRKVLESWQHNRSNCSTFRVLLIYKVSPYS